MRGGSPGRYPLQARGTPLGRRRRPVTPVTHTKTGQIHQVHRRSSPSVGGDGEVRRRRRGGDGVPTHGDGVRAPIPHHRGADDPQNGHGTFVTFPIQTDCGFGRNHVKSVFIQTRCCAVVGGYMRERKKIGRNKGCAAGASLRLACAHRASAVLRRVPPQAMGPSCNLLVVGLANADCNDPGLRTKRLPYSA